jgi:hypothetical protein
MGNVWIIQTKLGVLKILPTFKANLTGNQLEWLDEQPISTTFDKPRAVYVIFLEEPQVEKLEQSEESQFNEKTLAAFKS